MRCASEANCLPLHERGVAAPAAGHRRTAVESNADVHIAASEAIVDATDRPTEPRPRCHCAHRENGVR
eukprot:scaffold3029_cov33-Tisochrysis_lutea.AAC.7